MFGVKNPAVHSDKSSDLLQDILDWNVIESRCHQRSFNITTVEKIRILYMNFLIPDKSFSALSVRKLTSCADCIARSVISKLKDMDLLIPVLGQGKGVYRFKKSSEM